jgi:hypothetical protein
VDGNLAFAPAPPGFLLCAYRQYIAVGAASKPKENHHAPRSLFRGIGKNHCRIGIRGFAMGKTNVAFHELTHWTGAKSRLDRDLKNRFGTQAYAAEELIAELGAAFLAAEFSFDGDVRHAGYIKTWIHLLKSDKRAFFTACSRAQQAADYLRGLALREPVQAESVEVPMAA